MWDLTAVRFACGEWRTLTATCKGLGRTSALILDHVDGPEDPAAESVRQQFAGFLRELQEPSGRYPRRRPLKRPTAAALLSDNVAAGAWAAELLGAAGPFRLETVEVGRSKIGSNRLPAAAVFESAGDEIGFVGKTKDAARFVELASGMAGLDPASVHGCCGGRSGCWTSGLSGWSRSCSAGTGR